MKKLRIFMMHSEDSAVGYYRIYQPAYWLQKLGLAEIRRIPDDYPFLSTVELEEITNWADLLVFQRRETYAQFATIETIQQVKHKCCVIELDDDLINIDRFHPQYKIHSLKDANDVLEQIDVPVKNLDKWSKDRAVVKVLKHEPEDGWVTLIRQKDWDCGWLMRNSMPMMDAVTVTTETLKNVYSAFNSQVFVLKNCIDFDIWDKLPAKKPNEHLTIGWAGGWQHIHDLEEVIYALDRILRTYKDVHFHYVRCQTRDMKRLESLYPNQVKYLGEGCKIQDWPKTYADWNFDIGLAPLRTSKFNQGKSNLKWLENSARGIPTVASDISTYHDIEHGKTGYLCKTTDDWFNALSELINDPLKRHEIGQNAYNIVKERYNAKDNAREYLNAYKTILMRYYKVSNRKELDKCLNRPEPLVNLLFHRGLECPSRLLGLVKGKCNPEKSLLPDHP